MRTFGFLLIVIGLVWAAYALKQKTTVTTGGFSASGYSIPSQEVHNVGLIEDRRNHFMGAGFTTLIGVLLFGFGSITRGSEVNTALKACPCCGEHVQQAALKCRYCNSDISAKEQKELAPGASEEEVMKHYGIITRNGDYIHGHYRFSTLDRALTHARKMQAL